jgi:hypothetical protein
MIQGKSLDPADLDDLKPQLRRWFPALFTEQGRGLRHYIPHDMRLWEYASALDAFERWHATADMAKTHELIDIGSGRSAFGSVFKTLYPNVRVTESDLISEKIWALKNPPSGVEYRMYSLTLDAPEAGYMGPADFVTCLSVLEHIKEPEIPKAVNNLVSLIHPGGSLFLTCDYGPEGRKWVNDSERDTKFTPANIDWIADLLRDAGMVVGPYDTEYLGDHLYNSYSFFRLQAEKPE